jgi:nucleoside 2-deoxyribosyltransferase
MGTDEMSNAYSWDTFPNVYLAGPWADRAKMPAIATVFEAAGFTITHKWWLEETGQNPDPDHGQRCALNDLHGVCNADAVVVLNTLYSEGKAVEQGLALGQGIPLCLIGKNPHNVFYHLDSIEKVDTVEEALSWAKEQVGMINAN